MGRTGRLVTSGALILFLAFVALTSAPGTDVKIFATALGIGILLDATVVRALPVPALVSPFGRWNWWLPSWAAKLLFVEPSPLTGVHIGRHRAPSESTHRAVAGVSAPDAQPAQKDKLVSVSGASISDTDLAELEELPAWCADLPVRIGAERELVLTQDRSTGRHGLR